MGAPIPGGGKRSKKNFRGIKEKGNLENSDRVTGNSNKECRREFQA